MKYTCIGCNDNIDVNQAYHRGGLCFRCEMVKDLMSIKQSHDLKMKYRKMDARQLENAWQAQARLIYGHLKEYYRIGDEELRKLAVKAQYVQLVIQDEITRKSRMMEN